jgi:hypothetical protein
MLNYRFVNKRPCRRLSGFVLNVRNREANQALPGRDRVKTMCYARSVADPRSG